MSDISQGWKAKLRGEAVRFAVLGVINTGFTLMVYQGLLSFCLPATAYAIAWIAGVVFVGVFYPTVVFRFRDRLLITQLRSIGIYAVSFLLGLLVVKLSHLFLGLERSAVFLALAVTTLFNFSMLKWFAPPRGSADRQ